MNSGEGLTTLPTGTKNAVAYLFIAIIVTRCVVWLTAHRRVAAVVGISWLSWLLHSLLWSHRLAVENVSERCHAVMAASRSLVDAGAEFTAAWCELLAPSLLDLVYAVLFVWERFTNYEKIAVGFTGVFAWTIVQVYFRVRTHSDWISSILWEASFLVVAAVGWPLLMLLGPRAIGLLLSLMISVVPALLSVWAFRLKASPTPAQRLKQCRMWLSYWACWPTVEFVYSLAGSYAGDATNVRTALLLILVWLQMWEGSKYIPALIMKVAQEILLPLWLAVTANVPDWVRSPTKILQNNVTRITQLYELAKTSKVAAAVVVVAAIVCALMIVKTISGALSLAIWWGVGLKTTEIVAKQKAEDYSQYLAFWVLGVMTETLGQLPVAGPLILVWRPMLLVGYLVSGEKALHLILAAGQRAAEDSSR